MSDVSDKSDVSDVSPSLRPCAQGSEITSQATPFVRAREGEGEGESGDGGRRWLTVIG